MDTRANDHQRVRFHHWLFFDGSHWAYSIQWEKYQLSKGLFEIEISCVVDHSGFSQYGNLPDLTDIKCYFFKDNHKSNSTGDSNLRFLALAKLFFSLII